MPPPYHSISVASADSVLRFIDYRKPGLQVGRLSRPPLSVCFMVSSWLAQSQPRCLHGGQLGLVPYVLDPLDLCPHSSWALSLAARVSPGQRGERRAHPLPGRQSQWAQCHGRFLLWFHHPAGHPDRTHHAGVACPRGRHPADQGERSSWGQGGGCFVGLIDALRLRGASFFLPA